MSASVLLTSRIKNGADLQAVILHNFTLYFTKHFLHCLAPVGDVLYHSHFAEDKTELQRGKKKNYYCRFMRRNGIRDLVRRPRGHEDGD